MFFNSIQYAIFLPLVLVAFWLGPRRARVALLLGSSYVFYGFWDSRFLGLIVVSTLVDFLVGSRIYRSSDETTRRRWLTVSLLVNLGILGFFKYWGFFVDSAADLLNSVGLNAHVPFLQLVLPVGISFYTFQTLSYTIDIYRRQLEPEASLLRFALFVAFFPQLVAGPIERARRLLPQIHELPGFQPRTIDWGASLALILRGLFRKVVIADGLAPLVNEVFATPRRFGSLTVAMGVLAFSLQIYGDFAGYTDIARGTAQLFGVRLMENFRVPYFARSFSDFWRRWHISLSTWLRDYLYIPLGGNRRGELRTYVNLMATMLLGGLWHGAGWTFVIWGGMHGIYLVLERWRSRPTDSRPGGMRAALVFGVITLTWIPFRSPSMAAASEVFGTMIALDSGPHIQMAPVALGLLGLSSYLIDRASLSGRIDPLAGAPRFARGVGYGAAIVMAILFASQVSVPFIYFQF